MVGGVLQKSPPAERWSRESRPWALDLELWAQDWRKVPREDKENEASISLDISLQRCRQGVERWQPGTQIEIEFRKVPLLTRSRTAAFRTVDE